MVAVARAGLAARGVIYILIGLVAILVAVGHSSHQPDQEGALQLLASKPYGLVALVLLAIGFACYALWLLSQAAFGVVGEGDKAGPRFGALCRAVVYSFLCYLAVKVIIGSGGNEARKQQDLTATVLHHTGGQWLVGLAGLVVFIIGAALIVQGVRRSFLHKLMTGQLSARTRKVVEWLGVIGIISRGAVFALAGALVIDAAVTFKPSESGGLDKALLTLRQQPYGEVLLLIAALGLVIFGVYGLAEARWRKV